MKKSKIFAVFAVSAILFISLSACGGSSGASAPQHDSSTEDAKNQADTSISSNNTAHHDKPVEEPEQSGSSQKSEQDIITDAVITAVLNIESKKPDTTVDYKAKTMIQSGQKTGFEIIAAQNHQEDFKAGIIKEKNYNEVNNVALYQYKVDENDQLSLIETTTLNNKTYQSVVYITNIKSGDTTIDAIAHLKKQLNMNNDDIAFDDVGGKLESDKIGSYYTVKLISKSLRKNGGSGTAGIYNVYHDGTIIMVN